MHFWIDKPAGRNYGFGGRRYPCASSAPKSRSGQRGRRGREIGPMVTPVHRFQSLNGPASAAVHSGIPGPSATTRLHHQQQHHQQEHQLSQPQPAQQHQHHQQQSQQQQQPIGSTVGHFIPRSEYEPRNHLPTDDRSYHIRGPRPNIVTSNNVTNAAAAAAAAAAAGAGAVANNGSNNNERQLVTSDTTNSGLNSRANFLEGHFSEVSDTELAGYRLRCGVWITFVLATGFVSVAKFYFGNRDAGLDMLIFCGLLFTLLLSGCFYSTLFRRAQNTHRHHQDHLEQDDQIVTLAAALSIRDENARGFQVIGPNPQSLHLQMQQQQQQQTPPPPPPPPPPYHIAILIPPSNSPEEAPPPSYDKAMNEDSSNQTRVFIFSKDEDN